MKINDTDVSTYGFKYLRREISPPQFEIYGREWLKNAPSPVLGDRRVRYTPIKVTLLYEGTKQEYETMKSVLLDKIKESTIKFKDLDFYYDVSLDDAETEKYQNPRFREFTLVLDGYSKYKDEITELASRVSSKTINVPGTMETPCIVEITPSINLIDIVITGLGEEFKVKNLTAGKKIIINGEDGTVLENGMNKFKDYDGWEFPRLSPGSRTITFSQDSTDITIRYKPRWL